MIVTLHVWRLAPNRQNGAHAHKFACTVTDPTARGGTPSTSKAAHPTLGFANPDNEAWLDSTADSEGIGAAQSVVGQGRRWRQRGPGGSETTSLTPHNPYSSTRASMLRATLCRPDLLGGEPEPVREWAAGGTSSRQRDCCRLGHRFRRGVTVGLD